MIDFCEKCGMMVAVKKGARAIMLKKSELDALRRIAKGIAAQFGSNCEVVVHEVSPRSMEHSVLAIENGPVSGRKAGDGPSRVVLEQIGRGNRCPEDHYCYLTRTPDGKLLKSTSIYISDDQGRVAAILGINFDISTLSMAEKTLRMLTGTSDHAPQTPERIPLNVNDLLDDLLEQADLLIGKPASLMSKEEKARAVRFLNDHGAMLITKASEKITNHFGISKYTLYSYLDDKTGGKNND